MRTRPDLHALIDDTTLQLDISPDLGITELAPRAGRDTADLQVCVSSQLRELAI